jgi:hypothetical protein
MTKEEAKRRIDEVSKNYALVASKHPANSPEEKKAFAEYKRVRQELTPIAYGK